VSQQPSLIIINIINMLMPAPVIVLHILEPYWHSLQTQK
jgi:hypothetical protein